MHGDKRTIQRLRRRYKRQERTSPQVNRRRIYIMSGDLRWSHDIGWEKMGRVPAESWRNPAWYPSWQERRQMSPYPIPRTLVRRERAAQQRKREADRMRATEKRMARNLKRYRKQRAKDHRASSPPGRVLRYRQLERHG